jgi:hypothetical protein
MTTPLLSELREPPVVGRFYMVPAIQYPWLDSENGLQWWPVAGPLHTDADFFDFDQLHYHVDMRFLTAHQDSFVKRHGDWWLSGRELLEGTAGRYPLAQRGPAGVYIPPPRGRPPLIRRKCRRAERSEYQFADTKQVVALNKHYRGRKAGAEPLRLADGRILCPHRKYDLSQHTPDEKGLVVCPLHGLKVKCGRRK